MEPDKARNEDCVSEKRVGVLIPFNPSLKAFWDAVDRTQSQFFNDPEGRRRKAHEKETARRDDVRDSCLRISVLAQSVI